MLLNRKKRRIRKRKGRRIRERMGGKEKEKKKGLRLTCTSMNFGGNI